MTNVVIPKDTLVFDIETSIIDKKKPFSSENSKLEYAGFYSYRTNDYIFTDDLVVIQRLINQHKYLVGFNSIGYYKDKSPGFDIPVLKAHGIDFKYKIHIDCYSIFKKRAESMMGYTKEKAFPSYKLGAIGESIGLKTLKGEFDFDLLNNPNWKQDKVIIKDLLKYLKGDVKVTKEMYEFLEEYFKYFQDYLSKSSNMKKQYLTTSSGSYAYKVICNLAGLKEEYTETGGEKGQYEGGYVANPICEEEHGNIVCLDITSAYPHAFMFFNLFGRIIDGYCPMCKGKCKNPITANKLFPKLQGIYCGYKMHKITRILKQMFGERKKLKDAKDPKNYPLKIVLNSCYGITGNRRFKHTGDLIAAADCTYIARTMLKYANKIFTEFGYKVIYNDSDSIYLQDVFKDQKKLLQLRDFITAHIKQYTGFPQDTFDFELEKEIKHIFFFKDGSDASGQTFLKKNYIYVDTKKNITIKGLPIIKRTATKLSRMILNTYLKPEIKDGLCKFDKDYLRSLIQHEIKKDPTILGVMFTVKDPSMYKNKNDLRAQIARVHGTGKHILVRNTALGVGKSKKYCSIAEAKTLNLSAFDLSTVWSELKPFIKEKFKQTTLVGL